MRCYIYNYIWFSAREGLLDRIRRTHALLFLPRARNNGTGAAPALLHDFACLALASRSMMAAVTWPPATSPTL